MTHRISSPHCFGLSRTTQFQAIPQMLQLASKLADIVRTCKHIQEARGVAQAPCAFARWPCRRVISFAFSLTNVGPSLRMGVGRFLGKGSPAVNSCLDPTPPCPLASLFPLRDVNTGGALDLFG